MLTVSVLFYLLCCAPKTDITETVFYKAGDTVKKVVALVHFKEKVVDKEDQSDSE